VIADLILLIVGILLIAFIGGTIGLILGAVCITIAVAAFAHDGYGRRGTV